MRKLQSRIKDNTKKKRKKKTSLIKWAFKSEAIEEEEEVEYAITLPSFCSGLRVNYYDSSAKAKSLIRWYFRFGFLYNRIEPAQFEFLISF